jgi:vacuole morphology and inheritance protein 14
VRWADLIEKFKSTQDKARRAKNVQAVDDHAPGLNSMVEPVRDKQLPEVPRSQTSQNGRASPGAGTDGAGARPDARHKPKSSLGNLSSRLARGVGTRRAKGS